MDGDRVLVVMPMYNARPFVEKAVVSILTQTYRNFQFLIVNDGSTDGCEEAARAFDDDRIMVWDQLNSGPGSAMNCALQYAHDQQIQYMARMDADDISHPDRLEKQMMLLQKFPDGAACSANCYYIDSETEAIIGTSTVSGSPRLIHWEILHGLRGLIQGACLFRTEALYTIGGYRPAFKQAEEVDVFLCLASRYELMNSTEYLYKIRLNNKSLSMNNLHGNVLYQFYALDCANKRARGQAEQDFTHFQETLTWQTRYQIWREENLLKLWRDSFSRQNPLAKIAAGAIDPRRLFIRLMRKFSL